MRPEAEGQMVVRGALDVEVLGLGEVPIVEVGGLVEQDDLGAGAEADAPELDVDGDRAGHVLDR